MEHEIQNTGLEESLKVLSSEELLRKYHEADGESVEFAALKAELISRGYTFQPQETDGIQIIKDEEFQEGSTVVPLRYSPIGSLIWELVFIVLALGGVIYFIQTLRSNQIAISGKMMVTVSLAALIVISMGAIVGAVRRLANQKGNPSYSFAPYAYYLLSVLWCAAIAGSVYDGVKSFRELNKFSMKLALMSTIVPLIAALVSLAFVSFFFVVARESKS